MEKLNLADDRISLGTFTSENPIDVDGACGLQSSDLYAPFCRSSVLYLYPRDDLPFNLEHVPTFFY